MKSKHIWIHLIVKHILVAGLLWFYFKSIAENAIRVTTANDSTEVLGLILTVSGLVLAGAISGYFSFSYSGVSKPNNNDVSQVHLFIGHMATALQLLVIGILLFVAVKCLSFFTITSEMGNSPMVLSLILYLSLIFYDAFDLLRLRNIV